jgi:tryptophan synthase alpha chain
MERLEDAFRALANEERTGVIPFLTVGFPSLEDTPTLVRALVDGGAHVIELGVPFSDPLADGPTIQRSSSMALELGVSLETCLTMCGTLRSQGIQVPLVLMGYYNPIFQYGIQRFALSAKEKGVDGVIVADLPNEEAYPLRTALDETGVCLIPLLAPTSTNQRIEAACKNARGFIYCVSTTGVTGVRNDVPDALPNLITRIRAHTSLPIAVGFGISQRRHVKSLAQWADAAVVGSALIEIINQASKDHRPYAVQEFIRELRGEVPLAKEF